MAIRMNEWSPELGIRASSAEMMLVEEAGLLGHAMNVYFSNKLRFYIALSAILIFTLLAHSAPARSAESLPSDVASGWPGGWTKSMENRFRPHGYKIVNKIDGHPARLGARSIRFEVRPGDCGNDGNGWDDCSNDRERHELRANTANQDGQEMWYAYSLYIPGDTPAILPTAVHLGQFLQPRQSVFWLFSWGDMGLVMEARPPKAFGQSGSNTYLVLNGQLRNQWIDILVHAKWSRSSQGFFRVFVNHKLKFEFKGQTLAMGSNGDFKFGIYRSGVSRYTKVRKAAPPSQTVYYDEIHRGKTVTSADRVGIADIQTVLRGESLYDGPIDGLWTQPIQKAVNSWRERNGLSPVDEYGVSLWEDFIQKRPVKGSLAP